MKYAFIEQQRSVYAVALQCRVLGVSRSGFYAWRKRAAAPAGAPPALLGQIRQIHQQSQGTYGSPRVWAALRKQHIRCSRKRVAALMRQAGLHGRRPRRTVRTTQSQHGLPIAPNLLQQDFQAEQPNQKWVADITYIATQQGALYLAAVLDLFSRKLVGWSMAPHMRADLVEAALRMALYERQPLPGLLHHSDRGSQYASTQIRQILAANQIQVSMSRTANCYDNAAMESFFSTLKCERVHRYNYPTRAHARVDIFTYIAGFYNPR